MTTYKTPEPFEMFKDSYPNGPCKLAISGPPGCGKSSIALSAFIEPALCLGIAPEQILSCSFTRAAARVLRERLVKSTGLNNYRLMETCSTIHAEALRRFRIQFGIKGYEIIGDRKTYDPEEDEGPPGRLDEALPDGFEIKEAQAIKIWDLARNNLISDYTCPEFNKIVFSFDPRANLPDIRGWIAAYERNKKENKLLDFTDILIHGLRCNAPERELVIIDESQDSTELQHKLIEKWISKAKRSIYIFDFDQTIYNFSGACPEKIYDILDRGYVSRRLTQSYRVPKKAHALARSVILRNRNRIDAPYEPTAKLGSVDEFSLRMAVEELGEASSLGKEAFVLARSAKLLEDWVEELSKKGIPFLNERGKSPWGSSIAISVVRAVMAIRLNKAMTATDAKRLVEQFPGRDPEFFNKKVTKKKTVQSLSEWVKVNVISEDLEQLGLKLEKIKSEPLESLLVILDLKERATTLSALLERNGPEVLDKTPTIILTTIHSSKGREKDLVVVEMEAPVATKIAVHKDPGTIEAERRLCYVAFTRTKDSLILRRSGGYDLGTIIGMKNSNESD